MVICYLTSVQINVPLGVRWQTTGVQMSFKSMPMIGISNFASAEQVRKAVALFERLNFTALGYVLKVGVRFNEEAAMGFASRGIVARETLSQIFFDKTVVNCLHFSFMANNSNLAKHLSTALECAGMNIDSVQIDADWPDPGAVLDGVCRSRKNITTVLRIRNSALEAAGKNPANVVARLADYTEVIQGIQFHATHNPHNNEEVMGMIPYLAAVREEFPSLGIGISSHECAKVIDCLGPVKRIIPNISIGSRIDLERDACIERYLSSAFNFLAPKQE
jgi:hypothetical protein